MESLLYGRCRCQNIKHTWLRAIISKNDGQALVEALLVLPLLLALVNGIIWIGEMGRTKVVMLIAVREGARCESMGIPGEPVVLEICSDNLPVSSEDIQILIHRELTRVVVRAECEFSMPFSAPYVPDNYTVSAKAAIPLTIL